MGLVFSWDPRSRTWIRERGPEDAAPPPAPPIDAGAVQTYFLDPANGRWQQTILGLRARQIAAELKTAYRSAFANGLALEEAKGRPAPARRPRRALLAAGVAVLVVGGGGAIAAQSLLASSRVPTIAPPSAAPSPPPQTASSSPAEPSASPSATAVVVTVRPVTRAPAVTPLPAPTTITLAGRTPAGVTIVYTGTNSIPQGAVFEGLFTVTLANGTPSGDTLNVRLGSAGTAVNARTDGYGRYSAAIPANAPKGDQLLTVFYGSAGQVVTLGTLTIR